MNHRLGAFTLVCALAGASAVGAQEPTAVPDWTDRPHWAYTRNDLRNAQAVARAHNLATVADVMSALNPTTESLRCPRALCLLRLGDFPDDPRARVTLDTWQKVLWPPSPWFTHNVAVFGILKRAGPVGSAEFEAAARTYLVERTLAGIPRRLGAERIDTTWLMELIYLAYDGRPPPTLADLYSPLPWEDTVPGVYLALRHRVWATPDQEIEHCLDTITTAGTSQRHRRAAVARLIDHGDMALRSVLTRFATWEPTEAERVQLCSVLDVIRSTPGGELCRPLVDRWLRGPRWLADLTDWRCAAWLDYQTLYPYLEEEVYLWGVPVEGHRHSPLAGCAGRGCPDAGTERWLGAGW